MRMHDVQPYQPECRTHICRENRRNTLQALYDQRKQQDRKRCRQKADPSVFQDLHVQLPKKRNDAYDSAQKPGAEHIKYAVFQQIYHGHD